MRQLKTVSMEQRSNNTGLVSLNVGKQRVFCRQHHTADENAQQNDVAVVRMIA